MRTTSRVPAAAPTRAFDDALLRARTQAENYARALPATVSTVVDTVRRAIAA